MNSATSVASSGGTSAVVASSLSAATSACVLAERAVNRSLGGNCAVPLGAFAELGARGLRLRAVVASPDGRRMARADEEGPASDPQALGARVAERLRERGAIEILQALQP